MTVPGSATIKLEMPNQDGLFEHIKANRKHCQRVVTANMGAGKTVVICGAGPSLNLHHDDIRRTKAHQFWAANSALPYMIDHELPVTHGITVDQSPEMYLVDWKRTFPVKYLVGSCADPKLAEHLLAAKREIRWFHSYLGVKNPEGWTPPKGWTSPQPNAGYEMWLYQTLWPSSVQVGYGLNTVPRAICLALWMGFKKILVYGADSACAPDADPMPQMGTPEYLPWLKTLRLYADGRNPSIYGENAIMVEGDVDGTRWHTRPDMMISAVHLVDLVKQFPGRIELKGHTLPNAMMHKDKDFFDALPHLTGNGEVAGFGLKLAS